MGLTESLCERIVAIDDVRDRTALAAAQRVVLDGFAVALAGSHEEEPPKILAAHAREMGGEPLASVFGFGFKTSPYQAAYVNGVSMHVLDFEAMWYPPTHPTSTTLPAAAALTEYLGASGHDLLVAFLKGTEMQGRILLAARNFSIRRLNFHPPGVAGVMGATVAAAHLLHLDAMQLRYAIGIAASRAAALIANVGTDTKSTHCGLASAMGLECAMLAKRGFTGNANVLESGYFRSFFPVEIDEDQLLAYGEPFRLVDPGVAIKMFPSQYATHFGITAGLALHGKFAPSEVAKIDFTTPPMPYVEKPYPKTGLDGKFSLQYTLAAAILDGAVTIETFTNERRFRDDMQALLPKIELTPDETIESEFMKMHMDVRVTTTDGRTFESSSNGPKGLWERTPIAPEEHARKIDDCLGVVLNPSDAARLRSLIESIDELDATQLQECWQLLRQPAGERVAQHA